MFKISNSVKALLAAIIAVSFVFIATPAANAATASAGGNTCTYTRSKDSYSVSVRTEGCFSVNAGARYRVNANGNIYTGFHGWNTKSSYFNLGSGFTILTAYADVRVPYGTGGSKLAPRYSF